MREGKDSGNGWSDEMVQGNTDHWKVQAIWAEISGLVPCTTHLALLSSAEQSPLPSVVMGLYEVTDIRVSAQGDARFMGAPLFHLLKSPSLALLSKTPPLLTHSDHQMR